MSTNGSDVSRTADLPPRAQVVVVGGGVIGPASPTTWRTSASTDVLLVERHELTAGTTWHAAGLITSAGMTDETAVWMARYSRDLYARLEAETGHSTGFREIGHLHLACTPERLETLRRERGLPARLRHRQRRGLRGRGRGADADHPGRRRARGVVRRRRGPRGPGRGRDGAGQGRPGTRGAGRDGDVGDRHPHRAGRVTAVVTDRGDVECETVVLAAGLWTRELGRRCGVDVPLQAAEHYYLLTEPMAGVHRDLPVVEDPDRYGYYREEADGLLVGLFEPVGAPWHLDGAAGRLRVRDDRARLGPDDARTSSGAMWRYPGLEGVGLRTFFCGPESFTPDVHPLLGPAPEVEGVFVAAGMNSLGILSGGGAGSVVAQWIVDGAPPVDVTHYSVERALPYETTRRFRGERVVESLGVLFGDGVVADLPVAQRARRTTLGAARPARRGGRAVRRSPPGWEYPLWFARARSRPAAGRATVAARTRRSRTSPRSTARSARPSA